MKQSLLQHSMVKSYCARIALASLSVKQCCDKRQNPLFSPDFEFFAALNPVFCSVAPQHPTSTRSGKIGSECSPTPFFIGCRNEFGPLPSVCDNANYRTDVRRVRVRVEIDTASPLIADYQH